MVWPLTHTLWGHADSSVSTASPAQLRVIRYVLHLIPDYSDPGLTGHCNLTVENRSDKVVKRIPLLLYRTLYVDRVRDERGRTLQFAQRVCSFRDWGALQVNAVHVDLPEPLHPKARCAIHLDYHGWVMGYAETGMRYIQDRIDADFTILRPDSRVYPEVGVPEWSVNRAAGLQWFDYILKVTVPEGYTVANGGREVKRHTGPEGVTWVFRNIRPAWRMDAAIARYRIIQKGKNRVYHFPGDEAGANSVMQAMTDAMERYSNWFGPLEDSHGFRIIEIPEGWGSQADVTSIIQTAAAFRNPDQLHQVYHEIAHQWNVNDLDPLPSRFASEGFATYLQYRLAEECGGHKGALKQGIQLCLDKFRRQCGKNPSAAAIPMAAYGTHRLTGLSYTKGMVFFALLNRLMGDAAFGAAVGSFYHKYRSRGATTAQFAEHFISCSSGHLKGLFNDWVYGTKSSQWILAGEGWNVLLKHYGRTE